jgi:dipeptidyl aminopeptidase/acylaminoacyl peptidase
VLKAMFLGKFKFMSAMLLAATVLGGAFTVFAYQGQAQDSKRENDPAIQTMSVNAAELEDGLVSYHHAPAPKTKPGPGLIWMYNSKSGALTAYTPNGKKAKELTLQDGRYFLGFTPDGKKIAFIGKSGKLATATDRDGLTLHLRDVNDKTEGIDTGLPLAAGDWLVWSANGKRVIRARNETLIHQPRPKPAYSHTLYDLLTKKATKLDFPPSHQVFGIAPDDTWLLTVECLPNGACGNAYKAPLAKGKPIPLTTRELDLMSGRISPDGRTVVCFGREKRVSPGEMGRDAVYRLDVKSGSVTNIAHHDEQIWSKGYWSPDGNHVAYQWTTKDYTETPRHLVVCDPNGKHSKKLCTITDDVQSVYIIGWFPE